jgi:hypothetical protein
MLFFNFTQFRTLCNSHLNFFLTYGLFRNKLSCFQLIGNFPEILLSLISVTMPLWSENIPVHSNGQTEGRLPKPDHTGQLQLEREGPRFSHPSSNCGPEASAETKIVRGWGLPTCNLHVKSLFKIPSYWCGMGQIWKRRCSYTVPITCGLDPGHWQQDRTASTLTGHHTTLLIPALCQACPGFLGHRERLSMALPSGSPQPVAGR